MSAQPKIKYTTERDPNGVIALVPEIHEPFICMMDSLYPRLVSGSMARKGKGYSAFLVSEVGTHFIGSFTGMCLASVRKNPWFSDDGQWFLRSLLAAMTLEGYQDDHRSRCHADNYGTLRLWEKLGLGAKRTARGDYISATRDEATAEQLRLGARIAKMGYADIRAYADKKRSEIPAKHVAAILPKLDISKAIRVSCALNS